MFREGWAPELVTALGFCVPEGCLGAMFSPLEKAYRSPLVGHRAGFSCIGPQGASKNICLGQTFIGPAKNHPWMLTTLGCPGTLFVA